MWNLSVIWPWTAPLRDLTQTLFYVVAGYATVYTLTKARQTLLQPRWTESYKEQIKTFREINEFFSLAKEESPNLLGAMGILDVLHATMWVMFDRYAREVLNYEDYRKGRNRLYDEITTTTVIPGVPFDVQTNPGRRQTFFKVAPKFEKALQGLRRFRDDPFVPSECARLIEDFITTLNKNLYAIFELSEEIAHELTQKYPTPQDYDKAMIDWAEAKVHTRFSSLKEPADRILAFIREYTYADSIFRKAKNKKHYH